MGGVSAVDVAAAAAVVVGVAIRRGDRVLAARRTSPPGLAGRWELPGGKVDPGESTVEALHRYLTRTPARLLNVALTDAVGDRRAQNQPGTTNEYPNLRVPLTDADGRPVLLEDVFTSARARSLFAVLEG